MRTKNLAATGIAKKFAEAINAHDVDGLTKLMSSDHVLVDFWGTSSHLPLFGVVGNSISQWCLTTG